MTAPLTNDIVEKAYQMYREGITINQIATTLQVAHPTLAKYRDNQNWDERRQKALGRARKKDDDDWVKRRLSIAKMMQKAGYDYFVGKDGKLKSKAIRDAHAARQILVDGIRMEAESRGETSGGGVDNIILIRYVGDNDGTRKIVESEDVTETKGENDGEGENDQYKG